MDPGEMWMQTATFAKIQPASVTKETDSDEVWVRFNTGDGRHTLALAFNLSEARDLLSRLDAALKEPVNAEA